MRSSSVENILVFLVLVVAADSAMGQSMSGHTAGQFQVSETGAATYTVPLTVPPGTAGMEPKLSLLVL